EILAEQFDQREPLLRHQSLEQVAEFGLVEAADLLLERKDVAAGDRSADIRDEGGADDAILAVDVDMLLGRAGRRLLMIFQRRLPFKLDLAAGWTMQDLV